MPGDRQLWRMSTRDLWFHRESVCPRVLMLRATSALRMTTMAVLDLPVLHMIEVMQPSVLRAACPGRQRHIHTRMRNLRRNLGRTLSRTRSQVVPLKVVPQ